MEMMNAVLLGFLLLFLAKREWAPKQALIRLAMALMVIRVVLMAIMTWVSTRSGDFARFMGGLDLLLLGCVMLLALLAFASPKELMDSTKQFGTTVKS